MTAMPRSSASSSIGWALRLTSVCRLWVISTSKSQSRSSGIITSIRPAASPTASASPSSLIRNSSASAPPGPAISARSAACSGSCRCRISTRSRPSASRLASNDRRACAASKRPVSMSRSSFVERIRPSGQPPSSRTTCPIRASLRPERIVARAVEEPVRPLQHRPDRRARPLLVDVVAVGDRHAAEPRGSEADPRDRHPRRPDRHALPGHASPPCLAPPNTRSPAAALPRSRGWTSPGWWGTARAPTGRSRESSRPTLPSLLPASRAGVKGGEAAGASPLALDAGPTRSPTLEEAPDEAAASSAPRRDLPSPSPLRRRNPRDAAARRGRSAATGATPTRRSRRRATTAGLRSLLQAIALAPPSEA